ncbi:MAG: hypothetical protein JEZ12_15275 [Desulfobacterium sp.]|nr:hypothetical protein [Desulfobacterium sp.]
MKFTITSTSVDYDIYLGDESLSEAMVDENGTISGILGPPLLWTLHLDEVSLLEESAATCIWCWPPYLANLQGDRFRLATLNFSAIGLNGAVTMFSQILF